jgi:cytochrome o ubiquinol oxidase subunit 2
MRYGLLAVVLICVAILSGCTEGVLDPKGPIAAADRQILLNSLGIMLAIVIPVILATLGVAFWFRASNERARYRPNFAYSGRLEMLVWSIPAMTVFLVGGVAWVGSHDVSPRKPILSTVKPLRVQVASLDWKWLFIYPDQGVASVNRLTIPVGTPVSLELTSSGVMNSFFVPQLGSQIYTMAGMTTRLHLQADYPGTYRGFSAQFSGEGFADMHFDADAVTGDKFDHSPIGPSRPVCSTVSWRPKCGPKVRRAADVRHQRGRKNESTWQAGLECYSLRPADHYGRVGRRGAGHRSHPCLGHAQGLRALFVARVAHLRRS